MWLFYALISIFAVFSQTQTLYFPAIGTLSDSWNGGQAIINRYWHDELIIAAIDSYFLAQAGIFPDTIITSIGVWPTLRCSLDHLAIRWQVRNVQGEAGCDYLSCSLAANYGYVVNGPTYVYTSQVNPGAWLPFGTYYSFGFWTGSYQLMFSSDNNAWTGDSSGVRVRTDPSMLNSYQSHFADSYCGNWPFNFYNCGPYNSFTGLPYLQFQVSQPSYAVTSMAWSVSSSPSYVGYSSPVYITVSQSGTCLLGGGQQAVFPQTGEIRVGGTAYVDNDQCQWILTAPAGQIVQVFFTQMYVEVYDYSASCFDTVSLYDGAATTPFKQGCGNGTSLPGFQYRYPLSSVTSGTVGFSSTTNQMTVVWATDISVHGMAGFNMIYRVGWEYVWKFYRVDLPTSFSSLVIKVSSSSAPSLRVAIRLGSLPVYDNDQNGNYDPAQITYQGGTPIDVTWNAPVGGSYYVGFWAPTRAWSVTWAAVIPAPTISTVTPLSAATDGLSRITIQGANFGASGGTVYIGGVNCAFIASDWINTRVWCTIPQGQGTTLLIQLCTIYAGCVSFGSYFNYFAPTFTQTIPAPGDTTTTQVTIIGTNFGTNPTVTIDGLNCPRVSSSYSQIICNISPGVGANRPIVINVGGQIANGQWSWAAPVFTSVTPQGSNGGITVTINGRNFGSTLGSSAVTIGGVSCSNLVLTQAHIQFTCTLPTGTGNDNTVRITVGAQVAVSGVGQGYNYMPLTVASVTPGNGPTAGGIPITITGGGFTPSSVVTINYNAPRGAVAQTPVTFRNSTCIVTTLIAGEGLYLLVLVDGVSNAAVQMNYDAPWVDTSRFNPFNGPTAGGTNLTIVGQNFGARPGVNAVTRIAGGLCTSYWTNDTAIWCAAPPGYGRGQSVSIQLSPWTWSWGVWNYDPPTISSITPNPAAASTVNTTNYLTIYGNNFGPLGSPLSITLGGTYACGVSSNNHTAIICALPQGQGTGLLVQLSLSSQNANGPLFSFSPPVLSTVTTPLTTSGGQLTITGSNFGVYSATANQIFVGTVLCDASATACGPCSYTANRIICLLPAAAGGVALPVRILAGGQNSTNTLPFSFDLPHVSSPVTPSTGPTLGAYNLTVSGTSFGSNFGQVSVGGRYCPPTVWSHTLIVCTMPAGVGLNQQVVVSNGYDGRASTEAVYFSYQAPIVSTVTPVTPNTAGGFSVSIGGTNFGSSTLVTGVVTLNLNAADSRLSSAAPCNITSHVDNLIICTAPAGQGASIVITVSIAGQTSTGSLSYPAPTTTSVSKTQAIVTGGDTLTIFGSNFGVYQTVAVGGANCPVAASPKNHTYLQCALPAGRSSNAVIVTVSGRASNSQTMSYDHPALTGIIPASAGVGVTITITGNYLVPGAVTINGVGCAVTFTNITAIGVTVPSGSGSLLPVVHSVLITGVTIYSNSVPFSYSAPTISNIIPNSGNTNGLYPVAIIGTNFATTPTVNLGSVVCTVNGWNVTSINVTVPVASTVASPSFVVYVGGQPSNSYTFNYNRPTLSVAVTASSYTTLGGGTLTIQGSSFGSSGTITVGGSTCTPTSYGHSLIYCNIPPGVGASLAVVVTSSIGLQNVNNSFSLFSYAAPVLLSTTPISSPTLGGGPLAISGQYFGTGTNVAVMIGGKVCNVVNPATDVSNTLIRCTIPSGQGTPAQNSIVVAVPAGGRTATIGFAYDGPIISTLNPTNGPTNGGINLTMTGNNFGNGSGLTIYWGTLSTTVLPSQIFWISHQEIRFGLRTGINIDTPFWLDVSGQNVSSGILNFDYDPPVITGISAPVALCNSSTGGVVTGCTLSSGPPRLITISGTNFGTQTSHITSITVNGGACTPITWVSASSITCGLANSTNGGSNLPVVVTIGTQVSNSYAGVSYRGIIVRASSLACIPGKSYPPSSVCTQLSPGNIQLALWANSTNFANTSITFIVDNIPAGTTQGNISVKYGTTSSFATKEFSCPISFYNSTTGEIQCNIGGASSAIGVGTSLHFIVAVGTQISADSIDSLSFMPPSIRNVTIRGRLQDQKEASITGASSTGGSVFFDADYFGNVAANIRIVYRLQVNPTGDIECLNVQIRNISTNLNTLQCTTQPGAGGPYVFQIITLNSQSVTGTDTYSYPTSPVVANVTGCPTPNPPGTSDCFTEGGTTVAIQGANFPTGVALTIMIGNYFCQSVTYLRSSALTCVLPEAVGLNLRLQVFSSQEYSQAIPFISYAAPQITSITGCTTVSTLEVRNCAVTGGPITIIGQNFGKSQAVVLIGSVPCQSVVHDTTTPHRKLTCMLPAGWLVKQTVAVTQFGGLRSSNTAIVSYRQCDPGQILVQSGSTMGCQSCSAGLFSPGVDNIAVPNLNDPTTISPKTCLNCPPGYFANAGGKSVCSACAPGSFTNRTATVLCSTCPVGFVTQTDASVACTICPAGKSQDPTSVYCNNCPSGFFALDGAASCTSCGAGKYAVSLTGDSSTSCASCVAGAYSIGNVSSCSSCSPGSVANSAGLSFCSNCTAGYNADRFGLTACALCKSGYFSNSTSATVCTLCTAGKYSDSSATPATACTSCGLGNFQAQSGQSACFACPIGTIASGTGATTCTTCSSGSFIDTAGQNSCSGCAVGRASNGGTICSDCLPGYIPNSFSSLCVGCPGGKSQPLLGGSVCNRCFNGTFSDAGAAECTSCPSGSYSLDDAVSCSTCAAGYFSGTGSSTCTKCANGTVSGPFASSCDICPQGTAADAFGLRCLDCNAGRYASNLGQTECDVCPNGRVSSNRASLCTLCSPGFYSSSQTGGLICIPCNVGEYQPGTNQSSCVRCEAGYYNSRASASVCGTCSPGTYSLDGATGCASCSTGWYQAGFGASLCEACIPGKYSSAPAQKICLSCFAGFFSDVQNSSSCTACPSGRYQISEAAVQCGECGLGASSLLGSTICADCQPGFYADLTTSSRCFPCEPGFAQTQPRMAQCESCPGGKFAPLASRECLECPNGRYSSGNSSECLSCDLGSVSVKSSPICTVCEAGYYAPAGASECLVCKSGSYSQNQSAECGLCTPGFAQPDDGQSTCLECEAGKSSELGSFACISCPRGFFSSNTSSLKCDECPRGRANNFLAQTSCSPCAVGYYQSEIGQTVCTTCERGEYQNGSEATICFRCLSGTYTPSGVASLSCIPCEFGRFAPLAQSSGCSDCTAGYFAEVEGLSSCRQCAPGEAQVNPGSASCDACDRGRYSAFPGSSVCQICPSGTYGAEMNMSSCLSCPVGRSGRSAQNVTSSTSCFECQPGTYAAEIGNVICRDCPLGRIAASGGFSSCMECDPGTYRDQSVLPTQCEKCPNGTASTLMGLVVCPACPAGTYQNVTGQTGCEPCWLGTSQGNEGETTCSDCGMGFFTDSVGKKTCASCELGRFQTQEGASTCLACESGTYQAEYGQSKCDMCEIGKFNLLQQQPVCELCRPGLYQDQINASRCEPCGLGFFQKDYGKTACSPCGFGTFQVLPGQDQCIACQPGKFSNLTQQTACFDCVAGYSQQEEGLSVCAPCVPGFFAQDGSTGCFTCKEKGFTGIAPVPASTRCLSCPALGNAVPDEAGIRCTCGPGWYLSNRDDVEHPNCLQCPEGADCEYGGNVMEELSTKVGWWRLNGTLTYYECLQASHCDGGLGSGCAAYRTGPLCAFCQSGYHSQTGQGACLACPKRSAASGFMVFVLLLVLCVLFALYYIILRGDRKLQEEAQIDDHLTLQRKSTVGGSGRPSQGSMYRLASRGSQAALTRDDSAPQMTTDGSAQPTPPAAEGDYLNSPSVGGAGFFAEEDGKGIGLVVEDPYQLTKSRGHRVLTESGSVRTAPNVTYKMKIMLGFFQIVGNFAFAVGVPWPSYYIDFLNLMKVVNLDFIQWASVDCVVETDYYLKYLVFVATPIALFALLFVLYFVPILIMERVDVSDDDARRLRFQNLRRKFMKLVIFTIFLIYPSVSAVTLRLYVCQKVANVYYLVEDFTVQCYVDKWNKYAMANIIALLVYPIGVPALFGGIIWTHRKHLAVPTIRLKYGFLYDAYTDRSWWFELVDMGNKLFMTSILAFFPSVAQIPVGLCWNTSFSILILLNHPYLRKGDDRLHLLGQIEIFLLMYMGYILTQGITYDTRTNVLLSMVCIILTILLPMLFLIQSFLFARSFLRKVALKRALGDEEYERQKRASKNDGDGFEAHDGAPLEDAGSNNVAAAQPENPGYYQAPVPPQQAAETYSFE